MEETPLVSIVLLNYNGQSLSGHWESLFRESYPQKEIIFVDNGSSDGSAAPFAALAQRFPSVPTRIVTLPKNVGYSQGNNEGVRFARGEIVCLLGNDVEVDSEWIRPVLDVFRSDPSIGCVLPAVFRMADRTQSDRPWTEMDPFGFTHRLEATGAVVQPVFFTEGTSMFFRRSLLERLGYLFSPEFYFMHDDVDFCWRARLIGFSSALASQSRVFHIRGGTEPGDILKRNPKPIQTGTRNRLATMCTNYSAVHAAFFIPLTMLGELTIALGFWRRKMYSESRAVIGGLANFVRDIPSLRIRRSAIQRTRVVPDRLILAAMTDPIETPKYLFGQWRQVMAARGGSDR
jgi:GT2 family glycosyltransferase